MSAPSALNPRGLRIVLVLQGGGALGAYQAGVYQAMHEHGLAPDWVVGTSIGAINAALIAGNRMEDRLAKVRAFWERVSRHDLIDMARISDAERRNQIRLGTTQTVFQGVPGFFTPRLFSGFGFGMQVNPEEASFYDTSALGATLSELVDFDYLNSPGSTRLTVNAVNVATGQLAEFDSRAMRIGPDHVRASGSLPPAFAPVRIDGALYWDGGLYSNTPLESVLGTLHESDVLCFMVDLWSSRGPEPTSMDQVETRMKDVMYASRTKRHIADYARTHQLQDKLRDLYARLPPDQRTAEDARELAALGCESTLHIVRLPYSGRDWHMAAKDINFSKGSIDWRWNQGYADGMRGVGDAAWLRHIEADTHVVVHELPSDRDRRHDTG